MFKIILILFTLLITCQGISKCFNKKCYFFENLKTKTVTEAVEICNSKNLKLLNIQNEKENNEFKEFLNEIKNINLKEIFLSSVIGDSHWRWIKSRNQADIIINNNYDLSFRVASINIRNSKVFFDSQLPENKLYFWICNNGKDHSEIRGDGVTMVTWYNALNDCIGINSSLIENININQIIKINNIKLNNLYWIGLARYPFVDFYTGNTILYSNYENSNPTSWDISYKNNCSYISISDFKWRNDNCSNLKNVVCWQENNSNTKYQNRITKRIEKIEINLLFCDITIFILLFFVFIIVITFVCYLFKAFLFKKKLPPDEGYYLTMPSNADYK